MSTKLRPRIYVINLADYYAGYLHGAWIDATQGRDEIWAKVHRLQALSHDRKDQEWSIHQYSGFGPLRLCEYEAFDDVAKIGQGIAKHGVAFAYWAHYLTRDRWDQDLGSFESCYHGHWNSIEDYVQWLIDSVGDSFYDSVPSIIADHIRIDLDAIARDVAGDRAVFKADSGFYIFDA